MKSRKAAAVLLFLAVFALTGWVFVQTIWVPLYRPGPSAAAPAAGQDSSFIQIDALREDGQVSRSWSVADQQAIAKLRAGLLKPGAATPETTRADERYRLRIRRADATFDEFEVLLDSAGKDRDLLYVVRRNGANVVTGSAVDAPELRSTLRQILKPPAR